jgi:hypothetical protein
MTRAFGVLLPGAALAIALTAGSALGQSTTSRNDVVWHWFGDCASGDSLVVDVRFDGKTSTAPLSRVQDAPQPD